MSGILRANRYVDSGPWRSPIVKALACAFSALVIVGCVTVSPFGSGSSPQSTAGSTVPPTPVLTPTAAATQSPESRAYAEWRERLHSYANGIAALIAIYNEAETADDKQAVLSGGTPNTSTLSGDMSKWMGAHRAWPCYQDEWDLVNVGIGNLLFGGAQMWSVLEEGNPFYADAEMFQNGLDMFDLGSNDIAAAWLTNSDCGSVVPVETPPTATSSPIPTLGGPLVTEPVTWESSIDIEAAGKLPSTVDAFVQTWNSRFADSGGYKIRPAKWRFETIDGGRVSNFYFFRSELGVVVAENDDGSLRSAMLAFDTTFGTVGDSPESAYEYFAALLEGAGVPYPDRAATIGALLDPAAPDDAAVEYNGFRVRLMHDDSFVMFIVRQDNLD
jgi:hypothetical protein